MTELEVETIQRLKRCRFLPGSWQKRFVRSLATKPATATLSEAQSDLLWRVARSWSKQLGRDFAIRLPFGAGLSMTEMDGEEAPGGTRG